MSQQKKRNHVTVACINCRGKRKKCDVHSGENKCTRCIERNLSCIFVPGGKRGPRTAAGVYQNALITNPSSFIHDEQMPNNNQNNTIVTNINTHMTTETIATTETTATTEIFNNTQPSSNFHDQNISSFSTNDLNGSFYHETPRLYINPCDEATESSQEC
ncbi:14212_t:CDS:1, partial [Racocetra fulgida]